MPKRLHNNGTTLNQVAHPSFKLLVSRIIAKPLSISLQFGYHGIINIVLRVISLTKPPFWQRMKRAITSRSAKKPHANIPTDGYQLAKRAISKNALAVLSRLNKAGFAAHLVGGGVRDLLLQRQPKDFDIATNATPADVRRLFRNSRIIGRRFKINHVYFNNEIIEVSTYRANSQNKTETLQPAMLQADNNYGTIEEDAWRRDFTVNALFYSAADGSITDFTGGLPDLKNKLIRMIGNPLQRCHEDPVRLLRAIRLGAKLNFSIHPDIEQALLELPQLLTHVPPARLFDEFTKLFFKGHATASLKQLLEYNYLSCLFPSTANRNEIEEKLIKLAMQQTDKRYHGKQSLNPGFLLAVLLWPAFQRALLRQPKKKPLSQKLHYAFDTVITEQNQVIHLPKRLTVMIRSIWILQFSLIRQRPSRLKALAQHRYFRAACDFLCLRAEAGEPLQTKSQWWQRFRHASLTKQQQMIQELS